MRVHDEGQDGDFSDIFSAWIKTIHTSGSDQDLQDFKFEQLNKEGNSQRK